MATPGLTLADPLLQQAAPRRGGKSPVVLFIIAVCGVAVFQATYDDSNALKATMLGVPESSLSQGLAAFTYSPKLPIRAPSLLGSGGRLQPALIGKGTAQTTPAHSQSSAGRSEIVAQAKKNTEPEEEEKIGKDTYGYIVAGLLSNPIVWFSLYTKFTTGEGLPAGPYYLEGAAEGISYLVVLAFIGASAYSKATTGSGLPAGPGGLVGAAEGLSFLSLLGIIIVFGAQAAGIGGA